LSFATFAGGFPEPVQFIASLRSLPCYGQSPIPEPNVSERKAVGVQSWTLDLEALSPLYFRTVVHFLQTRAIRIPLLHPEAYAKVRKLARKRRWFTEKQQRLLGTRKGRLNPIGRLSKLT
jgi:hypothetical protein